MILVTGAGGFIGSHLVERLLSQGENVRAFVHYNSHNALWDLPAGVQTTRGDIRDYQDVLKAMIGVEKVYHLAALIGIPYSYQSPLAYIKTNTEGTYNVIEAALETDARVLIMSTSEVYGSAQYVPMGEDHPIVPQSPYAASKVAADAMAQAYTLSFPMTNIVTARPFNVFGPRQSPRAVIPTIIGQLLKHNEVILGNVSAERDFTFVHETCEGLTKVMSHGKPGEVYNVCSGFSISIRDIVAEIANVLGKDYTIKSTEERMRPKDSEVNRLYGSPIKLAERVSWMPNMTFSEGIEKTVRWYQKHPERLREGFYHV